MEKKHCEKKIKNYTTFKIEKAKKCHLILFFNYIQRTKIPSFFYFRSGYLRGPEAQLNELLSLYCLLNAPQEPHKFITLMLTQRSIQTQSSHLHLTFPGATTTTNSLSSLL